MRKKFVINVVRGEAHELRVFEDRENSLCVWLGPMNERDAKIRHYHRKEAMTWEKAARIAPTLHKVLA